MSRSRLTGKPQDYIVPEILKIWAGENYCDHAQLIYKSPPIGRSEWQSYEIVFNPKSNYKYITIQAYYIKENYPKGGNILLDNITSMINTNSVLGCRNRI